MQTRQQRAAETKMKLYATADRLFTQYGIDDVSVDAIVEAAGLSKGAFYVHFESKDALIASLISGYAEQADADYKAYFDAFSEDTPAADMLLSLTGKVFELIENVIGHEKIRVLYKVQLMGGRTAQTASGYNRAIYKMYSDVLERGVQRGEFKPSLPADELTRHFLLAIRGLVYEWCIRYPDFDLQQQARAHFEMLLSGMTCVKEASSCVSTAI